MSETLKNNNAPANNAESEEWPPFDPQKAEEVRREKIDAASNSAKEERTGDERYDLKQALDNANSYAERAQARRNMTAYEEMHPDRNHEHEMYRIAKKFGDIESHGFKNAGEDQIPEGINKTTYPQLEGETDEQYIDRLEAMQMKTDEVNGLTPHEMHPKQKRRMMAQLKRDRGENIEYDENGNYKF